MIHRRWLSMCLTLAAVVTGLYYAQSAGPRLSLMPSAGPVLTSVRAMGAGFDPNTCAAEVFFDSSTGQLLGSTGVESGEFALDVVIPAGTADGPHTILAVGMRLAGADCIEPTGETASATFTVGAINPGPFVGPPVTPFNQDFDLRGLPAAPVWHEGDPVRVGPGQEPEDEVGSSAASETAAPALSAPSDEKGPLSIEKKKNQNAHKAKNKKSAKHRKKVQTPIVPKPGLTSLVAGVDGVQATGVLPPDVAGDVGPNHFVQAVNAAFMIFDKSGNVLVPAKNINGIWQNTGTACETNNDGDPDVRYDPIADRWVIMQFVAFTDFCIAVSRTPDPVAGGWFAYDFPSPVTNDYPKLAVWPDAYYAGSQRGYPGSGSDAWAFDRTNMLAGNPAGFVRFFDPGTFMLPADLDGPTLPAAGAPAIFARQVDDAQFGGVDRIEMFEFHVDFAGVSTFTALPAVPTAPFDREICGFGLFGVCIPQPGTAQLLSSFTAWPLNRLQYRNSGTHETLIANHTVDADGADHAGVRWYELRNTGAWSIFQQGTHAPDGGAPGLADDVNRWMASAAMDKSGSIAVGYSVSSGTVFPGLNRAGRFASDPAGTLPQTETSIVAGGGSQTHSSGRWGDYSSMTLDPVDDCTFWYSGEYYSTTSTAGWQTRVTSFRLDATAPVITCPADLTLECSATGGNPATDPAIAAFLSGSTATDDCELAPGVTNNAPPVFPLGSTVVTFTADDGSGNVATCMATVTINDTLAPTITAPADVVAECTSPSGATPPLGTPVVADICDAAPIVTNDAPPVFPLGTTTVTWTATDHSGNAGADSQNVTVQDTTPPTLSLAASPSILWPPNHKLVTVNVAVTVADLCDASPTLTLLSIVSNEPDNSIGDGNTTDDIQGAAIGTDDRSFQLRSERQGPGSGRIYSITYTAADDSGNTTQSGTACTVPHDKGRRH